MSLSSRLRSAHPLDPSLPIPDYQARVAIHALADALEAEAVAEVSSPGDYEKGGAFDRGYRAGVAAHESEAGMIPSADTVRQRMATRAKVRAAMMNSGLELSLFQVEHLMAAIKRAGVTFEGDEQ
jgi:hypothetical protein